MTLSRPRTTGRVLRGSALGLGLLVAGGVVAPAAHAIEEPLDSAADQPEQESADPAPLETVPTDEDHVFAPALNGDFGTGKDFDVTVTTYGDRPADLDLSGAVFRATPVTPPGQVASTVYECTTDGQGTCSFLGPVTTPGLGGFSRQALTATRSNALPPAGDYVLTQVKASAGLAPNPGSATFTLCAAMFCGDALPDHVIVGDDSLFRTGLHTTVTDSVTGAPVGCVEYELTGPDYPRLGSPQPSPFEQDPVPAECLPVVTTAPTTSAPVTTAPTGTSPSAPDDATTNSSSETSAADQPTDDPVAPAIEPDAFVRDDDPFSFGTQTSDADGTLVFRGWFLPAPGYLLTPTAVPAGYTADPSDAFGITTTAREAAAAEPAEVSRTVTGQVAAGNQAPGTAGTTAAAGATDPGTAAAGTTTTASAATASPGAGTGQALATTGSPVGTMLLVGSGLVALGGGALATGTLARRRARQRV